MQLPLYQVDAFTSQVFGGNPAAVVPLESWLPDEKLRAIALENNLSETAYFVRSRDRYHLRWFTPAVEVDLCGHATLASAHVIFTRLEPDATKVTFDSRGGELTVTRDGGLYTLDFPALRPLPVSAPAIIGDALGRQPVAAFGARDYLFVFETEDDVRALRPNMEKLSQLDRFAVIVTAPGKDCDFVSRFFAPARGVNEDPVTGSAHCTLTPYWSSRLKKTRLHARQVSARGGELWVEDLGDRIRISGKAADYLEGRITIPD
jgi:PhzF family phenazine biosynthesis protein